MYDCLWGTDTIRVIVAGELSLETQNAPLHLFSASTELIGFGQGSYRRRSPHTSQVLGQLFDRLNEERFAMAYTWLDFERDYAKKYFPRLTPEEQEEVLRDLTTLSIKSRLAGIPEEQILHYANQLSTTKAQKKKPKKKK